MSAILSPACTRVKAGLPEGFLSGLGEKHPVGGTRCSQPGEWLGVSDPSEVAPDVSGYSKPSNGWIARSYTGGGNPLLGSWGPGGQSQHPDPPGPHSTPLPHSALLYDLAQPGGPRGTLGEVRVPPKLPCLRRKGCLVCSLDSSHCGGGGGGRLDTDMTKAAQRDCSGPSEGPGGAGHKTNKQRATQRDE